MRLSLLVPPLLWLHGRRLRAVRNPGTVTAIQIPEDVSSGDLIEKAEATLQSVLGEFIPKDGDIEHAMWTVYPGDERSERIRRILQDLGTQRR